MGKNYENCAQPRRCGEVGADPQLFATPVQQRMPGSSGTLNRAGFPGESDLRWVLLPNSFLKLGSLFFLDRQFELDR